MSILRHLTRQTIAKRLALKGCAYKPFFLLGALWAIFHFFFWLPSYLNTFDLTGIYGPIFWHAHEMLFGFGGAILSGFLLTVVPNWTGVLPFSEKTIYLAVTLWLIGRLTMMNVNWVPILYSATIDSSFLIIVVVLLISPIITEKNWRDLKVLAGVICLAVTNIYFHLAVCQSFSVFTPCKIAISTFTVLVIIVGGRMIPAYKNLDSSDKTPTTTKIRHTIFDTFVIFVSGLTLFIWSLSLLQPAVSIIALAAALLNYCRLLKWQIWSISNSFLLVSLYIGYGFIPIAFFVLSLSNQSYPLIVVHIIAIGVIAITMLSVMIRLCLRYHAKHSSFEKITSVICCVLIFSLLTRFTADFVGEYQFTFYCVAAAFFVIALFLFIAKFYIFNQTDMPKDSN